MYESDPIPDPYPFVILASAIESRIQEVRVISFENPEAVEGLTEAAKIEVRVEWKIGVDWIDCTHGAGACLGPIDERFFNFLHADFYQDEVTLEKSETFKQLKRLHARRIRGKLPEVHLTLEYHEPETADSSVGDWS